jgi:hypothetical protein
MMRKGKKPKGNYMKFVTGSQAFWVSTICIILFYSGLQISFIDIIGQYFAKTYIEAEQWHIYIIMEER